MLQLALPRKRSPPWQPLRVRARLTSGAQLKKLADGGDDGDGGGSGGEQPGDAAAPAEAAEPAPAPAQAKESLLTAAAKARKEKPAETDSEKILKEEQDMLRAITQRTALKSVKELAKARPRPSLTKSSLTKCLLVQACLRVVAVPSWAFAGRACQALPVRSTAVGVSQQAGHRRGEHAAGLRGARAPGRARLAPSVL